MILPRALALALLCAAGPLAAQTPPAAPEPPRVSFNEHLHSGIAATVDVKDPVAVFALVFEQLPDRVTVYTGENYYYWSFFANGRPYWGNIRLDAATRDNGILHIGYFEYDENAKFQDTEGFEKELTAADGVELKKVDRWNYTVAYKGKTVAFRLFAPGMDPPKKAKLRADEVFVGPVVDESGIRFHLIFNKTENHFHYLLNEDVPPGETYRSHSPVIQIGRRTGFAYYVDAAQDRKVLIAVHGPNVARNNYYDGPFDQLPDNYADETKLSHYLELAYPALKGKLNKYGHIAGEKGVRATPFAYYSYFDENDLNFVGQCQRIHARNPAKFYACITPDPQKPGAGPPPKK
jgi:hypothetical protein